jgi:hypothetical protein
MISKPTDFNMKRLSTFLLSLFVILTTPMSVFGQLETVDDAWAEVSRTVAEGDFEGYGATYHPDAVLVNGLSGQSYPIATALSGWKPGFDDTKSGKQKSGVEFRFTQRIHSETTAHDTGIFHYWFQTEGADVVDHYVHFDGLFVKKGGWLMVMEYQKSEATLEDWAAIE